MSEENENEIDYSSGILDPEIVCKYSYRYFIPHFLLLGSVITYYYYLIARIPSGIKLKYLIDVPQLQPLTIILFLKIMVLFYMIFKNSQFKNYIISIIFTGTIGAGIYYLFPNYIISKNYLMNYLQGFTWLFISIIGYVVLLVKTSKIEVQGKDIVEYYGVFGRTNDPTDLSWVKDKNISRNPLERILGTGTLSLSLTKEDEKGRKVVKLRKLTHINALAIQKFLRENAFDSYREQRRVENLMKRKKSKNRENYIGDDEFDVESED